MTGLAISFILSLVVAFFLFLATAVLISYCKKREGRTRHGLTGMCHQSGGQMCSSCSSQIESDPEKDIEVNKK